MAAKKSEIADVPTDASTTDGVSMMLNLRVGDMVKVIRAPEEGDPDWGDVWLSHMDHQVGKVMRVTRLSSKGVPNVCLDDSLWYPEFCLVFHKSSGREKFDKTKDSRDDLAKRAMEAALDAGALIIQDALGVDDGGGASTFFSGAVEGELISIFAKYFDFEARQIYEHEKEKASKELELHAEKLAAEKAEAERKLREAYVEEAMF